jgi:hypothetical protein
MSSVKDSPGWFDAVAGDANMASSVYNILLAYSTDGVNPFRSGQYTLWPMVMKVLNLPPSSASSTALIILAGVVHGPKKPKSMQAYQLCVADELRAAYDNPVTAVSPDGMQTIRYRVKLLLHSCDGPANGLVSNQQCSGATWGCIKCLLEGKSSLHRMLYGEVRRWLPLDHPYRTDPDFGEPELRAAPARRTLEDALAVAQLAHDKLLLWLHYSDTKSFSRRVSRVFALSTPQTITITSSTRWLTLCTRLKRPSRKCC